MLSCRRIIAGLFVLFLALGSSRNASARIFPDTPVVQRFTGQVTSLLPDERNPTVISLDIRTRIVDMRLSSTVKFIARSAEAEVQGLVVGDYATVYARRVGHVWLAQQIIFDVKPFSLVPPPPVTLSGSIVRVTPDQHHFVLKVASGNARWVHVTSRTKFRMDGQILNAPPMFNKGDMVQVVMRWLNHEWVALDVNLKTTVSPIRNY